MAISRFVDRSGGEGGPVGPSSRRDAATVLLIATPEGQGEKAPRTSLATPQVAPLPAFATASPGRLFASVMPTPRLSLDPK